MARKSLTAEEPRAFPEHLGRNLVAKRAFRAMNTKVEVTLQDWSRGYLLDRVEQFFLRFECRFSRFLPYSELSHLNAGGSCRRHVSPDMLALLLEARRLHGVTHGVFDPTIITRLEAAGYDRSFDVVARESDELAAPPAGAPCTFEDIEIDEQSSRVTVPTGVRIDLGGIGKGYAIDRAAELLKDAGPSLISAGGDLFGRGDGPQSDGWLIVVTGPPGGDEVDRVVLRDQAVATSTVGLRTWRRAGRTMHHIIDPATGLPADSGLTSVTVIAGTATDADVFAKTALILGLDEGLRFLDQQGAQALLVADRGDAIATERWPGTAGR